MTGSDERKRRALISDDCPQTRAVLHMALGAAGITDIIEAQNGIDIIVMIRWAGADIVVVNHQTKALNGLEVTRQIRNGITGIDAATPIILLTDASDEPLENAAYALGVNRVIRKPFPMNRLITVVTKLLGERDAMPDQA
jgi:CheY-like chemotaxis protein